MNITCHDYVWLELPLKLLLENPNRQSKIILKQSDLYRFLAILCKVRTCGFRLEFYNGNNSQNNLLICVSKSTSLVRFVKNLQLQNIVLIDKFMLTEKFMSIPKVQA